MCIHANKHKSGFACVEVRQLDGSITYRTCVLMYWSMLFKGVCTCECTLLGCTSDATCMCSSVRCTIERDRDDAKWEWCKKLELFSPLLLFGRVCTYTFDQHKCENSFFSETQEYGKRQLFSFSLNLFLQWLARSFCVAKRFNVTYSKNYYLEICVQDVLLTGSSTGSFFVLQRGAHTERHDKTERTTRILI